MSGSLSWSSPKSATAILSHELRTPLNGVPGFTEMLGDPDIDDDLRDLALGRIRAASAHLLDLIETMLAVGHTEPERQERRLAAHWFPDLWRVAVVECARLPQTPSVRIEWMTPVPDLNLSTDAGKLGAVIRSLVGNALKFTEKGFVRVEAEVVGGHRDLRVQDTGIGIRPQDRELIFEMFRQADGSDSRRYGGAGRRRARRAARGSTTVRDGCQPAR